MADQENGDHEQDEAVIEEQSSDDELAYQEKCEHVSIDEDFEKIDIETDTSGFLNFLESQSSTGTLSAAELFTLMKEEHKKEISKLERKHKSFEKK